MGLFGTAGIRGKVVQEINGSLARRLGIATVMAGHNSVFIARDTRTSSSLLKHAFLSGFIQQGGKAFDAGKLSYPELAWLCNLEKSVGVYVTASHNPPDYNGFKFIYRGVDFSEQYEKEIESQYWMITEGERQLYYQEKDYNPHTFRTVSRSQRSWIRRRYLRRLEGWLTKYTGEGIECVVDASNGMTSPLTASVLSKMGHNPITINAHEDGLFPGRLSEPKPDNLGHLMNICKKNQIMGLAHDGDGDRVAFITEEGKFVDLSRSIALIIKIIEDLKISNTPNKRYDTTNGKGERYIVTSVDTTSTIEKIIKDLGDNLKLVRTRLGYLSDKGKELVEEGNEIVLLAEPWKAMIPAWGFWVDGVATGALVVSYLSHEGITLTDALKPIPASPHLRIDLEDVDPREKQQIFQKLCNYIEQNERVIHLNRSDGNRYLLDDDSWILIRMSGTERKIRLYIEGKSANRARELSKSLESIFYSAKNENSKI